MQQWVSFNPIFFTFLTKWVKRTSKTCQNHKLWDARRYQQELRISTGVVSSFPHVSESNSLILHRAKLKCETHKKCCYVQQIYLWQMTLWHICMWMSRTETNQMENYDKWHLQQWYKSNQTTVNWAQLSNRRYVDTDMLPGSYPHRKYIVCMVWNII